MARSSSDRGTIAVLNEYGYRPLKRELEANGFDNVAVVARGVDTRRFSPQWRSGALRATWGADADTMVVLSVGRLAAEKNLAAVLDAYEGMRNANPAVKLVMVGDGPERDALRRRCPEACFAGQRTGEDLARHYASADVFLFPSQTETFGNVTPEAMAGGRVAKVLDGDIVRLDAVAGTLDVLVDEAIWAARPVAPYTAPPATGFGRELFANFRRHAGGAEQGACTWL